MSKLKAIKNHIVFQFTDEFATTNGVKHFKSGTDWGFEFARHQDSTEAARWVKVIAVGPEVDDCIQPGMEILVEPLKWTDGVKFEGEEYWRTDSTAIMAIPN